MVCSLTYAFNALLARFARYRNMPSLQFSADSMIAVAILTLCLFFAEHARQPFTIQEAWAPAFGSILMVAGILLLNAAMAYGKAGPAQAMI